MNAKRLKIKILTEYLSSLSGAFHLKNKTALRLCHCTGSTSLVANCGVKAQLHYYCLVTVHGFRLMIKNLLNSKRWAKLLSLVFASMCLSYAEERPNIVWIFSDDHAPNAIGAYGGRFEKENITPHLDQLAKEGMIFDRAYVANSICAPSRATLLTGKHSHMNGKYHNGDRFNHDQNQFQKVLHPFLSLE